MATAEPPQTAPRDRRASAAEIAVVLAVPCAYLIATSVNELVRYGSDRILFDDRSMVIVTVKQVAFLAVTGPFLYWREWWLRDMTAPPRLLDLSHGSYLFVAALAVHYCGFLGLSLMATPLAESAAAQEFTGRISTWVALLVSAMNPVFEEFLFLGYGYTAMARRIEPWAAAFISVWLRTAAHAYQGRLAFLSILPFGILMTAYYLRTGRLWPVIIAHATIDLVAIITLEDRPSG